MNIEKKSLRNIDIDIDKGIIKIQIKKLWKIGTNFDNFCLFSAYFCVFSSDLLIKYRKFISIVDISANLRNIDIDIDKEILENIDIDIDIDKVKFENIDIDIDKKFLRNIDIDKKFLRNIDIDINIDKKILKNIDIDIDINKKFLRNIDIDIDIDKKY